MQFDQSNVKPGMTVICGDKSHPMKARKVMFVNSDGITAGDFHNPFVWSEITAIVSDETEWHSLTRENIEKYLAVGDEVEVEGKNGSKGKGIIKTIGETWDNSIKLSDETIWVMPDSKFRLIRKGKQEEAKGEEKPVGCKISETCDRDKALELYNLVASIKFGEDLKTINQPKTGIIQKAMSQFNKFVDAVKIAKMSETDKLLYEGGMKDIEGNYTQEFNCRYATHEAQRQEAENKAKRDAFALTLVETIKEGKKLTEEKK